MITAEILARIFPSTPAAKRNRFLDALNKFLPEYGIDSYLRVCAFLATFGVETDYAKTTVEYASGEAYEGRRDLGNTHPGDGVKFKGRGGFQTTGRSNYERLNETVGAKLGIDFIKNPERLAEVDVAIESACIFYQDNHLSKYADTGDFRNFSSVVNCGRPNHTPNQWAKRNELYSLCKRTVPRDFSFEAAQALMPATQTVDPAANPQNPLVVTPTENNGLTLKEFSSKYLVHCPTDTVKNIFFVVLARIVATGGGLWRLGFQGKALVFLISFAAIVPVVWAIVYYRSRLFGWIKTIVDSLLGN